MAVLRGHGFVPIRAPGSGTGDWDLPDVLAGQDGILMASELKSGKPPKNVRDHEVDALNRVADAFIAASLVVVRYSGDRTFYLCDPARMKRTPSGHYSIPSDESRLPWSAALPYQVLDADEVDDDEDRVQPQFDVGVDGVVYATDDPPPSFTDWLDALTAEQQGYRVRRGVVDMKSPADEQRDDDDD